MMRERSMAVGRQAAAAGCSPSTHKHLHYGTLGDSAKLGAF
jgi:hypothetical protein